MRRTSFTLVEVLVTIAIIVILAGILVGGMGFASRRADEAKTISQIEQLSNALEECKADRGFYPPQPSTAEVVLAIESKTVKGESKNVMTFNGKNFFDKQSLKPYLNVNASGTTIDFTDAWGRNLHYKCPGDHNAAAYDLWSAGPDGDFATEEDNVTNWGDRN